MPEKENKKIDDLVVKLEVSDEIEFKYVDIELNYRFDDQDKVVNIVSSINSFISTHKEGLTRENINILGYTMY